ncbi:hypothetical protein GGI12_005175 [Dipsacomyces acuminosporus]|nr:hypothetical protein GGI12_005175 [Dipsacomyces acuminosporus]
MKLIVASIAVAAAALAPVNGYAITDTPTLNCRSGPGTNYDIVRTYSAGEDIQIVCQQFGEKVISDNLWNRTPHGCFVADYYVNTGTNNYVARGCCELNSHNCYGSNVPV